MPISQKVRSYLEEARPAVFAAYAMVAAFSTYFSMYAFRKPFSAAVYQGFEPLDLPGVGLIEYKTVLIISQVLGYCLSKFIGIKIISEMSSSRRAITLLGCIGIAWGALLLFAIIPAPYNTLCLFLNGLPLGMVWGLTFGFLEGRQLSDILGAGLSVSYIVASSMVKAIGLWLIDLGVPELWMPFATGAIFALPMAFFVFLLASMPPPSEQDIASQSAREPMDGAARIAFFSRYAIGLVSLTGLYILLTAYRDFRDNFSTEIWLALGYSKAEVKLVTAGSELPAAIWVFAILALLTIIRTNRTSLIVVHWIMLSGTVCVGISTALFQAGLLGPVPWMMLIGLGLYAGYVPFGCVLFDRLIATVGAVGTAGFLIYVTDAFGYLGSVGLMLYKDLGQPSLSWLDFFIAISYITSAVCTALYLVSLFYFSRVTQATDEADPTPV